MSNRPRPHPPPAKKARCRRPLCFTRARYRTSRYQVLCTAGVGGTPRRSRRYMTYNTNARGQAIRIHQKSQTASNATRVENPAQRQPCIAAIKPPKRCKPAYSQRQTGSRDDKQMRIGTMTQMLLNMIGWRANTAGRDSEKPSSTSVATRRTAPCRPPHRRQRSAGSGVCGAGGGKA